MLLCLLLKDGTRLYRLRQSVVTALEDGAGEGRTPLRGFEKKVLVVSKELTFHTRKKYPPATKENLRKAVEAEIEELIPIKNPQFCMQVSERTDTFTLVDLWGWDSAAVNEVRRSFRFHYVLPEDLLFYSDAPEVILFEREGVLHAVACGEDGWKGSISLKEPTVREMEFFLRGTGRFGTGLMAIRCLTGENPFGRNEIMGIPVDVRGPAEYLAILSGAAKVPLRDFKAQWTIDVSSRAPLVARSLIYVLLAVSLGLYLAALQHDTAIRQANAKLSALRAKLSQATVKGKDDTAALLQEFYEKRKGLIPPLKVMNALAGALPPDTAVQRMVFGEKTLDMTVVSKEPLRVMEVLSSGPECIASASIKGAINMTPGRPVTFPAVLELKPCR
jgi:hypothetical protein